ncbi:hypothetical protein [Sorangium sp. So ce1024]|uniref:hypothetical protein n=1 Tax=Sorangium sp. So ce1024 TaxID=3133327 RepID=UPI003F004FA3
MKAEPPARHARDVAITGVLAGVLREVRALDPYQPALPIDLPREHDEQPRVPRVGGRAGGDGGPGEGGANGGEDGVHGGVVPRLGLRGKAEARGGLRRPGADGSISSRRVDRT